MSSPDNVNWSLSNFLESIRPGYASLYFETLTELGVDDPMELEAVTVDLLLELSVKKLHAIRIHKACLAYTKDSEENIASKDFVVSSMVVASNPSSTTSIVSMVSVKSAQSISEVHNGNWRDLLRPVTYS